MKTQELILLAALGAAAYLTLKKGGGGFVNEVRPSGAQPGWKYYANGTSIGPDGTYYKGDTAVYDPQAFARSGF